MLKKRPLPGGNQSGFPVYSLVIYVTEQQVFDWIEYNSLFPTSEHWSIRVQWVSKFNDQQAAHELRSLRNGNV
jgi:hypothetical protein